jgi:NAD(P)-dependent dehydrogenase (short-subunit alcohol dehydrogenase family)
MTMTRNLGDTLFREEGVRVNLINPGWVLTENETHRKLEEGLPVDWYTSLSKMYAPAGAYSLHRRLPPPLFISLLMKADHSVGRCWMWNNILLSAVIQQKKILQ